MKYMLSVRRACVWVYGVCVSLGLGVLGFLGIKFNHTQKFGTGDGRSVECQSRIALILLDGAERGWFFGGRGAMEK